ncbi:MAG: SLBB domain-containing protein [Dehalococcoidia bacterium]
MSRAPSPPPAPSAPPPAHGASEAPPTPLRRLGLALTPLRVLQAVLLAAALLAFGILATRAPASPGVEVERRDPAPGIDEIRVQVGGAVRAPGVVVARPGDRVADAIERAGGLAPEADSAAINLARRVLDQDQVIVPKVGDCAPRLLDLNRATQAQLEALPGIGPARATAILAARARAPFASTDELVERGLVSASVYAQLRDLIGVAVGER